MAQLRRDRAVQLVWYAAYGSNLHAARFACYLSGGTPVGAARANPGCRDRSDPRAVAPVTLPGGVYFALESSTWSGGVAFYDPTLAGTVPGRAYLLTTGQFCDVVAQETRRAPGVDLDLDLDTVSRAGRHQLGPGPYQTLLRVGSREGHPVLTFTAPGTADDLPANAPSAAYLRVIGLGLRETHGWSARRAATYLCGLRGARGAWDVGTVQELLTGSTSTLDR